MARRIEQLIKRLQEDIKKEKRSVYWYRSSIVNFIDGVLLDVNTATESLRTNPESCETYHSLQFCSLFLRDYGHDFLLLLSVSHSADVTPSVAEVKSSEFTADEKRSLAFCTWLVHRLLRLLAAPGCSFLHPTCIEMVGKVLHIAKVRSLHIFNLLATQLVRCAADLISLDERLYSSPAVKPVLLKRLNVDLDLVKESLQGPGNVDAGEPASVNLRAAEIEIPDPHSCELLQANLMKILKGHFEICHFNPVTRDLLMSTVCCQLELGDVELKMVSMETLVELLKECGLPELVDARDYLVSCVLGMMEFLLSGCNSVVGEDVVRLESGCAKLLETLVETDTAATSTSHLSSADLQRTFTSVLSLLLTHGVQKVTTGVLRTSVAGVVCHVLKKLPPVILTEVCGGGLEQVAVLLVGLIGGDMEDVQFVVPLLVRIIMLEMSVKTAQPPRSTPASSATTTSALATQQQTPSRLKRKRMEAPSQKEGRRKKSRLYQALLEKTTEMLDRQVDQANLASVIEAASVITEVGARCVAEISLMDADHRPSGDDVFSGELVHKLCGCWQNYLLSGVITRAEPDVQKRALERVTCSVGSLLACHDLLPVPPDVQQELVWMISLPWLLNDPSWRDLRPKRAQDIYRASQQLADRLDVDTMCQCIRGLSLAPKEAASSWRVHVFTQALTDTREAVKETAVSVFPMLLHNLGPNTVHLITDLLHPVLREDSVSIQNALASIVGGLVCVAAHSTVLDRQGIQTTAPVMEITRLHCTKCGGKEGAASQTRQVEPKQISPFLSLLKARDVGVRKCVVKCLLPVFRHIPVRPHHAASVSLLTTCLCCVEDEDYHVRTLFSQVIPHLLVQRVESADPDSASVETDRQILDKLKATCVKAVSAKDVHLHQTVLVTVGQLARVAEGELLLSCLITLLENRLSCTPLVASTAFIEIQKVAAYRQVHAQKLFSRFKPAMCKFLAEAMLEAQSTAGRANAENILKTVSGSFQFQSPKTFLQGCEKHLLPHLISKASPDATSLVRLLATTLSVRNHRKLIMNNIKDIFSYLVRFCQKQELEKALDYLQKETDFELGSLLRLDFQRVHNELLLHLSTNYKQVFSGLQMLSMNDEQYEGPRNIRSPEEMAKYLEPRLLGVLAFFDSQLTHASVPLADKKLALESLIPIVKLMGSKRISSISYKVMNTLRLGLQFKDRSFMEVSCRAWNCFVRSLELSLLGPMMFQIVATLLPLLLQMPRQVSDIINYMVVENRAELQNHFHEIYFLPDLPELADANAVLKSYTDDPSSQGSLQTQLMQCIKGCSHENFDVRIHALSKLRRLLREKRDSLYELILGSETAAADPVISQLVSVLLQGCRESHSKAQCLYGQCLGELGALDPGRLQLMSNNPREQHAKFQASVDDDNFAVGLINEICKAFLAATEPRVQDCSAYALQELLQIYGIHETGEGGFESHGTKLWKRFSEQFQAILRPLQNSKYRSSGKDLSNLTKPIYGSSRGGTLLEWVSNWTNYLAAKVNEGKAHQVFQACGACNRHNLKVALYLLPHVVVQVLLDGKEENQMEVYNEVMEVVNQATKTSSRQRSKSDLHPLGAQTVFSVLDYLFRWRDHRMQLLTAGAPPRSTPAYAGDPSYRSVNAFLCRIAQDTLANASLNCKAFTRALMHFEQFITDNKQDLQKHLDFLQKLYDCLNEADGVLGVAAIRQSPPTLMQEILVRESLGQQQDTQACYERALQTAPNDLWPHQGLVRSLLEMGQLNKALLHTTGVLADNPQWTGQLNQYRVEAAWKMSNWDRLDSMMKLEKPDNHSWPVCIGRVLMSAKDRNEEEFVKQLQIVRQEQMGPLSAASMEMGSYLRGYECIMRLHMLSEVEEYFRVLHDFPARSEDSSEPSGRSSMGALLAQWDARLQMAQSSLRTQEPILTLRRTLLSLGQRDQDGAVDSTVSKWWLWSAKVARKAGHLQAAYGCLLQAAAYDLPEFYVEKAKFLWEKGENDSAISCLEKGISRHFAPPSQIQRESLSEARKRIYAQALLLYSRYSEETSSLESNAIVKRYRNVIEVCEDWEDGHFYLAQYYDRVMTAVAEKERPGTQPDFVLMIVKLFGNALTYGNQYIYQAMPRLLSLWLDFGASVSDADRRERSTKTQSQKLQSQKAILARINKQITQLIEQLAPYQFFTAFPQLVSRICHAQPDVAQILQELISSLLACFPQQAMWMMMSVSKSSYPVRSQRCREIFATAQQKNPSLQKVILDATKLTERLLEVCDREMKSSTTLSLAQHFKPLKRLLDDSNFSEILLPLQSAMTVTLPSTPGAKMEHNPFPDSQVYIKGFEDTIEILPSLARPKKITMVGSDGKLYTMLCKPKDDLRKDCRLMEFNAIVNRFLRKDAESRRRQLHIRTYTVTPLNEECGLLEWVSNTNGVRNILLKLYKERGHYISGKELKALQPPLQSSVETKMGVYKKLLDRHPPILREWFLRTFPDPTSWYNARVAYARTAAVMSMIGYILGLGDRHLENILLDSTKGDAVHVDFNCLFNKGETFEWPERVPFRLTQNMVSALGPMGVEGIFRRACEVTLRVIRSKTDPLMSILKPFIYDPLVEWSRTKGQRSNPSATETGEITNEQALNHVQNIEDRLHGILKNKRKAQSLPLSIEGHVNYLIQEATDEKNLCQMYIGWAPFM